MVALLYLSSILFICTHLSLCHDIIYPNLPRNFDYLQPAFYEAFGLTVVEAMTCGLPTFATCHGGPAEIIEHGVSGFHIDPYHPDQAAALLVDFFQKSKEDPSYWDKISEGGLKRIYERSRALLDGINW